MTRLGLTRSVVIAALVASTLSILPARAAQAPTSLKTFPMAEAWVLDAGRGIAGFQGFELHFAARLTSSDAGVAGRVVAFSSDGFDLCTAITGPSGYAQCSAFGPGTVSAIATNRYQVTFDGDEQFLPSTATGDVLTVS